MYPTSNQPAQLYGTAKTYKHENIDEINIQSLNFRPIIAQTGSYTFNAAQVISNYLKPLYTCNKCITGDTQDFSKLIQEQPPLQLDEEYFSYDIESLFTNLLCLSPVSLLFCFCVESVKSANVKTQKKKSNCNRKCCQLFSKSFGKSV